MFLYESEIETGGLERVDQYMFGCFTTEVYNSEILNSTIEKKTPHISCPPS